MKKLNITNLKPWGPFLTIYGHDDSGVMKDFQEKMIECLPNLSRVYDFKLEVGELYIFVDLTKKECFRCTPMNATGFDLPKVKFIDYGFDREISMDNEFMEVSVILIRFCRSHSIFVCFSLHFADVQIEHNVAIVIVRL